ncbi:MAG: ATP-binding cassette domain-containing protein [Elusimicrobia bacterium]|nr:ATP-binding cassette domain-containing protein [Elusimicrobiota bacterium]
MIRAAGVMKSFGARRVLRGLDIGVNEGETLVIIGGSGCGKSTFLKCVIGLLRPDGGSIEVDGVDVSKVQDEVQIAEYRRKFGYCFQEGALFDSMTIFENVSFGLRYLTDIPVSRHRGIARDKLALVGLKDIEDMKPAQLSGGMKKRVALARAIAAEPRCILYDEPTTGLDPIMSDIISELILDLKKKLKVTAIAVTHDMKSAYKIGDRIAMLHEGRMIEVADPQALKSTKNPYVRQFIEGHREGPIRMKLREYGEE